VRYSRAGALGGLCLALSAMLVGAVCGEASASLRVSGPSNISYSSFGTNFNIMEEFKPLTSAGHGKVAAILPDTVSSTRYVELDAPDIIKALSMAGLSSSHYVVQNALGSDATQLTDVALMRNPVAQAARNFAAKILLGLSQVQHRISNTMTELDIAYPHSPLTVTGPQAPGQDLPRAGERWPISP